MQFLATRDQNGKITSLQLFTVYSMLTVMCCLMLMTVNISLQCSDTVGLATGRAPSLYTQRAWLRSQNHFLNFGTPFFETGKASYLVQLDHRTITFTGGVIMIMCLFLNFDTPLILSNS